MRSKNGISLNPNARLGLLLVAALALRLVVSFAPGYKGDILDFSSWAHVLASAGPLAIYGPGVIPKVDYPPGYLYVLWMVGGLHALIGGGDLTWRLLLKLPAICVDIAAIALLYRFVRRYRSDERSLAIAAVAAFAPSLWFDSAYWGQIDGIPFTASLLALFFASEDASLAAWMCLAAGALVKPQALVIAPVLLVLHARRFVKMPATAVRDAVLAICGAGALAYAVTVPFTTLRSPVDVFAFLFARYAVGLEKATDAAQGAFNLYTIAGPFFRPDATAFAGLPFHVWGIVLVAVTLGAIVVVFSRTLRTDDAERRNAAILASAALCTIAVFLFATRMHERYVLPALIFAIPLAFDDLPSAAVLAWFTLSFVINCSFVIAGFYGGSHHPGTVFVAHAISLVNVLAFGLLAARAFKRFA